MLALPEVHEVVTQMSKNNHYRTALAQISTLPPLRVKSLKQLTPKDICTHLQRARGIGRRRRASSSNPRHSKALSWGKNECLVFEWLTVCYLHSQQVPIQLVGPKEIEFLASCFPKKDPVFLQYELKRMSRSPTCNRSTWNENEAELFRQVIDSQATPYVWSDIAVEVFRVSEATCYKTPASCRQMWNSYLVPGLNKSEWTPLEDYKLLVSVKNYQKRWALISRKLGEGRTEHMVKNRYKALRKKLCPKSFIGSEEKIIAFVTDRVKESIEQCQVEQALKVEEELVKVEEIVEPTIEPIKFLVKEEPQLEENYEEGEPLFDSYEERYLDIEGMLQERYESEEKKEAVLLYSQDSPEHVENVSLFEDPCIDARFDLKLDYGSYF